MAILILSTLESMKQSDVLQVVHFNIRKGQKLELVNLKCVTVTYAQPIFLSLSR